MTTWRGLAAWAVGLVLANVGLFVWLSAGRPDPAAGDIVTVWRQGARVGREVTRRNPLEALASEAAVPGTTRVLEHVSSQGRVLSLGRRLFGWSFVAGRDGVRATLDGRDAFLTPDDLRQAGLYRTLGVDADGVLDHLARALGVSADQLWRDGRFRRFTVTRTVFASAAPQGAAGGPVVRDATPTGARLTEAIKEAAGHLARRSLPDGRFAESADAASGTPRPELSWSVHAEVVRFITAASEHFDDVQIQIVAQRAGSVMRTDGTRACGAQTCIGDGERVEIQPSALALLAYCELAPGRVGRTFRELIAPLAAFLRTQQRRDGGFAAGYDRARGQPTNDERGDFDADAVLALARAHRITHDPADLDAAVRGLAHLVSRPAFFGARDTLTETGARICEAADELSTKAPLPRALAFCLDWTETGAYLQVDGRGPVPELAGGFARTFPAWMPDLRVTADRAEGGTAVLAAALRAGQGYHSLVPLGQRVTRAFELLLRAQLPGASPHLLRDPAAVAGGFATTATDLDARLDATAAAGSAMLRYLRLLEARGLPAPPSHRARSKDSPAAAR
ncbi:MAG TPA: hypothetical protein VKQ32_25565 [Polyangia bacterium]|nr:hypothetical protein [Polyangia bacterium]